MVTAMGLAQVQVQGLVLVLVLEHSSLLCVVIECKQLGPR